MRKNLLGITIAVLSLCSGIVDADKPLDIRAPNTGRTWVIAHRGAHIGIPENTLAAYERAIELGADFVEIDVRTTKDGKFVSIHNRTIDAYVTDGRTGKVSDFTLAELKALDIGSRVDPQWKEERIPTLDEIFELSKGRIGIYLDLKEGSIEGLVEIIRKHEMQRDVLWCISPHEVAALRKACPECIPMPDPPTEDKLPAMIRATRPKIIAPVWRVFTLTFAQKCHEAGALCFVDEEDSSSWENALEWGADGIQTDDPEGLIKFLKARSN